MQTISYENEWFGLWPFDSKRGEGKEKICESTTAIAKDLTAKSYQNSVKSLLIPCLNESMIAIARDLTA